MIEIPWFNAEGQLHADGKPRVAGLAAMGLWVLAGTLATGTKTDGFVPRWYVESWPDGPELADRLVTARLWDRADGGYQFRDDEAHWRSTRLRYGAGRQSVRPHLRAMVYERDGHTCKACGSDEDLTVDHIYPWSLGGTDDMENLQTLCRSCNSSKGAKVAL